MNDNAPEEKFPTSGRTIKGANQIEDKDEKFYYLCITFT